MNVSEGLLSENNNRNECACMRFWGKEGKDALRSLFCLEQEDKRLVA